jgi:large conductance mechanosensitive channel
MSRVTNIPLPARKTAGEFRAFLTKSNALALAIGVIIGGAMGKVVTAIVSDLLMPIVGLVLPKGDWRDAQVVLSTATDASGKTTVNALKYGDLLGNLADFVVIALVVFLITKALIRETPAAPSKECPFCRTGNAVDATKCKACASAI